MFREYAHDNTQGEVRRGENNLFCFNFHLYIPSIFGEMGPHFSFCKFITKSLCQPELTGPLSPIYSKDCFSDSYSVMASLCLLNFPHRAFHLYAGKEMLTSKQV